MDEFYTLLDFILNKAFSFIVNTPINYGEIEYNYLLISYIQIRFRFLIENFENYPHKNANFNPDYRGIIQIRIKGVNSKYLDFDLLYDYKRHITNTESGFVQTPSSFIIEDFKRRLPDIREAINEILIKY